MASGSNPTTFFDLLPKSFADVPITDEGVDTVTFLEASDGLVKMFDLFDSSAFSIVQKDISGNIAKVRAYYLANPEKAKTLESLVISEKHEKKRTATEGLMWLLRGLQFTLVGLQSSYKNKDEELSTSFTTAYAATLRQYHNFVVKGVFSVAMKACPYRADFYKKLGEPQEKVNEEMEKWLVALDVIVDRMQEFYKAGGHDKGF